MFDFEEIKQVRSQITTDSTGKTQPVMPLVMARKPKDFKVLSKQEMLEFLGDSDRGLG